MKQATKVEFPDRPAISVGGVFNDKEVTRIEVYHTEYEDGSEVTVIPYSTDVMLGKFWNYPCGITYAV